MKAASYGIVDFKTITNKSLSIQARAIYCYLSCYANKNHTAFPCRERILKELGISKNGYYKHYHQLEDNCIMRIERSRCKNNKYHLFFRKLAHTQKFGFAHKDIMTNPNISLAAKVVFTYITAYCPPGRTWHFKKNRITDELGMSSYLFAKTIKELESHNFISITVSQYQVSIMNIYDSSEKGGQESFENEDISAEKRGHESSKIEDTVIKKRGHENTTNEDTEQSNSYHYLSYQSCLNSHTEENSDGELRKGMSGDEIRDLAEKEISTGTFKKHNFFYFILVMTKYVTNRHYVKRLNDLLKNQEMSFSSFAYAFLQRYEYKINKVKDIKSPIGYMTVCLYEFIGNYEYLKEEVSCCKPVGYLPTYDIAEYESYSVLDELDDNYSY